MIRAPWWRRVDWYPLFLFCLLGSPLLAIIGRFAGGQPVFWLMLLPFLAMLAAFAILFLLGIIYVLGAAPHWWQSAAIGLALGLLSILGQALDYGIGADDARWMLLGYPAITTACWLLVHKVAHPLLRQFGKIDDIAD